MAGWYAARRPNMSSKMVIALALLAFALVAAVPVALLAGVIMMLLGHVIGGLALFGGSILAATVAVVLASVTGVRRVSAVHMGCGQAHQVSRLATSRCGTRPAQRQQSRRRRSRGAGV